MENERCVCPVASVSATSVGSPLKILLPPGHQTSQLKSLYHSTAHECTCYRSCYTNSTVEYINNNVAASRSPRAASLEHSTAHECACYRSSSNNTMVQYTNKNVAAPSSPRAASTSNVEKLEVHHICPSARQHVEKGATFPELRCRFADSVEKIVVHQICPSARQHVEEQPRFSELRSTTPLVA